MRIHKLRHGGKLHVFMGKMLARSKGPVVTEEEAGKRVEVVLWKTVNDTYFVELNDVQDPSLEEKRINKLIRRESVEEVTDFIENETAEPLAEDLLSKAAREDYRFMHAALEARKDQ